MSRHSSQKAVLYNIYGPFVLRHLPDRPSLAQRFTPFLSTYIYLINQLFHVMKLTVLFSTLLLSAVLAAPVPSAPDATVSHSPQVFPILIPHNIINTTNSQDFTAPAASSDGSDLLGLDHELGDLGLPPLSPPSPRAVSVPPPSATSTLELQQALDELLGATNGGQTSNSNLGGIKKRTSDPSPPNSGLDLNSLLGDLTGSQSGDANGLSGILPTTKRAPQSSGGSFNVAGFDLSKLMGGLGAIKRRAPQSSGGSFNVAGFDLSKLMSGLGGLH
jgi:hypothetical protein